MAERLVDDVIPIVKKAGQTLREMFAAGVRPREKADRSLVTEADLISEQILLGWIKDRYPSDLIISEESGRTEAKGTSSGWAWIVDPLDGTSNFANKLPYFCISVAFGKFEGSKFSSMGGVVYDPMQEKMFYAQKGSGAFWGSDRIHGSAVEKMSDAYMGCGLSLDGSDEPLVQAYLELCRAAHGSRRMGAAALDLCYVAAGVFDIYFAANLKSWDMAAACLIIEEAGSTVTNFKDELLFDSFSPGVVAGNKKLVEFVKQTFAKYKIG
jgi:myo-inositol-1(or 4)-monophosphatase